MRVLDDYKTDPKRRRKAFISLGILFGLTVMLWLFGGFEMNSPFYKLSLYTALLSAFAVPKVFVFHVVRGGDSDPLQWYASPFVFIIPGLLLCFYYMFW